MFCPQSYTIIASLFPRLLGFIYFCALGALLFQIRGLIGKNGILPLTPYLDTLRFYPAHKRYYYFPTLFWINSSNQALMGLLATGVIFSVCLMFGIFPSLMLLLLYIIHLSIITAGQDFLSFGWEGLLLEITAQAFLMSLTVFPNLLIWISINFLLFRFHFQAGIIKLQTKDANWRNLTAIAYHYQTQPLPNTIAWYAHKLPLWFQKISVLIMFTIEIFVPFGIFFTEEVRFAVFICLFALQYGIWLTGNFSYLNTLTVVFSTILISNSYLSGFISPPALTPASLILDIVLSLIGIILIGLQLIRLWHHLYPNKRMLRVLNWISPFHLVNRYAIFANMTTERLEVIIEGSEDGQVWKEYLFKYKPSEINYRPRRIAPYQPRLDWQAWFLPFRDFGSEVWFQKFLIHLLKGTPDVLQLLRHNPFPEHPPKYIRSLLYEYKFSSFQEKKEKGCWWQRTLLGAYSPTVKLKGI